MKQEELDIIQELVVNHQLSFDDRDFIINRLAPLLPDLKMTGSARWGSNKLNDIDFISNTSRDFIDGNLPNEVDGNIHGSLGSIRFKHNKVNLICLTEREYQIWSKATDIMPFFGPIFDKNERHGVFEMIRAILKMVGI